MSIALLSPDDLIPERNRQAEEAIAVDARSRKQFQRGHIPGAVWMGWEEWCDPAPRDARPILAQEGYWGVLAQHPPEEFGRRLGSFGINFEQPLVIYGDGTRSRGREGRIAWMLLYLGAPTVYLLDGGWSRWLAQTGEVQLDAPQRAIARCNVALQSQRRCTLEEVRRVYESRQPYLVIDARSQPEFDGEIQEYLPRRGRLPSAILVPFCRLFDTVGLYINREAYLDMLPSAVRHSSTLVAYCEVGVRAALFAVLHEAFTGTVVPVFDGSLMQWSLDDRVLPIESILG